MFRSPTRRPDRPTALRATLVVALAAVGAVAGVGCSSGPKRLYDGPARPDAEVSILRNSRVAKLLEVDGRRARDTNDALLRGSDETYAYALLPGRHRLEVGVVDDRAADLKPVGYEPVGYVERPVVEHDFVAGRTYGLDVATLRVGRRVDRTLSVVELPAGGSAPPRY